jgi:hypothetical protein
MRGCSLAGVRQGGGETGEGAVAGPAARRPDGGGKGERRAHDLAGPVSGAIGVGAASEQCRVECVSCLFFVRVSAWGLICDFLFVWVFV